MFPFRTTAPTAGSPAATMALIVANISVFLYQIGLSAQAEQAFIYTYALVPAVYSHPELARGAGFNPDSYLPFITNTFMHAGFLHLIFNMWTLWLFGAPLEDRLGRWRYLAMYLACGTMGSGGHLAFNLDSTVPALGASGAIAGILGGYTLIYPRAKVALVQPIFFLPLIFCLPAVVFTGLWFVIQVVGGASGLTADKGGAMGGIAWWAHVGGFLAGLGLVWLMVRNQPAPTAGGSPMPPTGHDPVRPRQGRKWRLPDVGDDSPRSDKTRDPGPLE